MPVQPSRMVVITPIGAGKKLQSCKYCDCPVEGGGDYCDDICRETYQQERAAAFRAFGNGLKSRVRAILKP